MPKPLRFVYVDEPSSQQEPVNQTPGKKALRFKYIDEDQEEPVKEQGMASKIASMLGSGVRFNEAMLPSFIAGISGVKPAQKLAAHLGEQIAGEGSMAPTAGRVLGESLPFMAAEGPLATSKLLSMLPGALSKKIAASALTSGAQSALLSPEERLKAGGYGAGVGAGLTAASGLAGKLSPLIGAPLRAGIGGALGYQLGGGEGATLGAAAGGLAPYAIPGLSKKLAQKAVTEGVDLASAAPRLEAAKRLGLDYLTPAEATGSPFVGAMQGSVGKTGEGSKLMYEKSQGRLASERKAISDLKETIFKRDELDPQLKSLYEKSLQHKASPDFVDQVKESHIVKSAFDKVEKDPVYKDKLKDIPQNSFAYLDQVKRALNDMSDVALRSGEKDKARLIKEQTTMLTKNMDAMNPEYADARALAQRDITRKKLEKGLNDKDIRGTNFYNKFLKNDENFAKLKSSLHNVPEAQQKLDDMKLVFQDLINPQTARTGAALTKTGMTQGRNPIYAFKDEMNKLNGQRYDKSAIELITNPHWDEEFRRIMDMDNKAERAISFTNLLSKLSSSGIASSLTKAQEGDSKPR